MTEENDTYFCDWLIKLASCLSIKINIRLFIQKQFQLIVLLARNNAYCACFDNLHGTVRRRSTKCKHCQKVGSSKNNSHTTKNNNSAESTLKKLTKTVHAVQGGQGKMGFLFWKLQSQNRFGLNLEKNCKTNSEILI